MTTSNSRPAEHPIDRQFLERWSPLAFMPPGASAEGLQKRETLSPRNSLATFAAEGRFTF